MKLLLHSKHALWGGRGHRPQEEEVNSALPPGALPSQAPMVLAHIPQLLAGWTGAECMSWEPPLRGRNPQPRAGHPHEEIKA